MSQFNLYWFELFERGILAHHASLRGESAFKTVREAITVLIELLQNPDPDVRYEACWSLHKLRAKDAIPELQNLLDDHRKPVGATPDHATVAIIAQFAIDFLNDWNDD